MTSHSHIVFIGAGNMATAIIGGLLNSGIDAKHIEACAPSKSTRDRLSNTLKIATCANNVDAVKRADVIVLAVKPQVLQSVCEAIAGACKPNTLFISVAAGVTCANISAWLQDGSLAIVRSMPNTPSKLGLGACGLFGNAQTSVDQKLTANRILEAVGKTVWVDDESLINTVTAVSGSGPAYFFLIFEAMIHEAQAQGLNYDEAKTLTLQTAKGAAALAEASPCDIAELRKQVTSPNGTTERAIQSFENDKIRTVISHAMQACAQRARELAN